MAKRGRREGSCHRILVPALAVFLSSAASAGSLDSRELLAAPDRGFSPAAQPAPGGADSGFGLADRSWLRGGGLGALPGRRGSAPPRLSLPLPEPSFASRLRWEIDSAGPAPPAASGFLGWLPSILLAGAFAATEFALDPPKNSRWADQNGFDDEIRSFLRGGSRHTRRAAGIASDALLGGTAAALVADWWWLRGEYGFLRSIQVDSRWILANNVTTRVAKVSAGRQRPYVRPCAGDPDYVSGCGDQRQGNSGFFSGHASNTATMAGLLCARHLHRRDSDAWDAAVCAGGAAGAVATGILRIVADDHFATDVIAGWAVGALFGYVLPSYFDYPGESAGAFALRSFNPVVAPDFYGVQFGFRF